MHRVRRGAGDLNIRRAQQAVYRRSPVEPGQPAERRPVPQVRDIAVSNPAGPIPGPRVRPGAPRPRRSSSFGPAALGDRRPRRLQRLRPRPAGGNRRRGAVAALPPCTRAQVPGGARRRARGVPPDGGQRAPPRRRPMVHRAGRRERRRRPRHRHRYNRPKLSSAGATSQRSDLKQHGPGAADGPARCPGTCSNEGPAARSLRNAVHVDETGGPRAMIQAMTRGRPSKAHEGGEAIKPRVGGCAQW